MNFVRLIGIQAVQQQLFYTKECIYVKYFQAIAKSLKKENAIYMKQVLHFDVGKRRNSLRHAKPILGKIHVT